jgi:polyisoprenyl-teichoic acid--peptidoglycan teichoic acid transferase
MERMNCPVARHLLEQGVRPGSAPPERAALGFHLAGCADCRVYRTHMDSQLLSSLLAAAQTLPQSAGPALIEPAINATAANRARRVSFSQVLWYGGLGLLATFLLAVVIIVVGAALSIFTIHQNVQAMIVPTAGAQISHPTAMPVGHAAPTATAPIEPTLAPAPTQLLPTATLPPPSVTPIPTALPPTPTPPAPPAGDAITILLLGSDQRPGETDPARTDAIIVARIDPHSGRVALLSLPRDLWVEIPGYGYARLNAAHVWGIIYNAPAGGVGLARQTVSNLLGIPIDYTMQINFQGFIGAIDALGGVTVDVPKELYDDQFPTMDYGYTVAHFLPGPQQMDGTTALMYSRIRHPDSDFERMRRQQAVVVAVMARIREQNPLQSLKSLEDVTAALRAYVQTDLPEDRMIGLAWALRDFSPEHVERYVLDEHSISFGVGDDRWAEVADPSALAALTRQLIGQ